MRVGLVVALAAIWVASPRAIAQESTAGVSQANGVALFRLHCSSGYCHGEGGKGGGAPELRGRHFDVLTLADTVMKGVPGTAMPAFAGQFSASEVAALVGYIRSLDGEPGVSTEAISTISKGVVSNEESRERVLSSTAEMGRQLFFDANSVSSCRTCHTFQGRGGKVGPDLSHLDVHEDDSIRRSILEPSAGVVPGFERLEIVTRDGSRFIGVKRDEDPSRLRFFDTSTMPPVSRSLLKSEIETRSVLPGSVMPEHTALNEEQIRALIAFLKSR